MSSFIHFKNRLINLDNITYVNLQEDMLIIHFTATSEYLAVEGTDAEKLKSFLISRSLAH